VEGMGGEDWGFPVRIVRVGWRLFGGQAKAISGGIVQCKCRGRQVCCCGDRDQLFSVKHF